MPSVNKVIYGNQTLIDLTDATASADTILEGYTAYGANGQKITGTVTAGGAVIIRDEQDVGGGTIRYITASSAYYLQDSKEVTPTKSVQNVTPDTGYNAFETVKVNPIPNEYIVPSGTSNITENGTYGVSTYANVAINVQPDLSSLTVTPTESAQAFPPSGFLYDGYSTVNVGAISSTYVGTGITRRSASNLTASGSTVTVPSGYYSSQVTKNVNSVALAKPSISFNGTTGIITATETQGEGYVTGGTTTSTVGLTTRSSADLTFATGTGVFTAPNGYYNGATTYTLTPKTSANITVNGSAVTTGSGYYSSAITVNVASTPLAQPAITLNNTTGLITATTTQGTGYVTGGTSTSTYSLTTVAAQTITPTTASQLAVASGRFTTGSVYVGAIPSTYVQPTGTLTISTNGTYDVTEYASVSTNISEGERFAPIYKNLAFGNLLYANGSSRNSYGSYTASDITDWCDSLSTITNGQFANQIFSGDFSFNNVSSIGVYAFGSVFTNVTYSGTVSCTFDFPSCTYISNAAFYQNKILREINLPLLSQITSDAFYSCESLKSINAESCQSIHSRAFVSAGLTVASFPQCSTLGAEAFRGCSYLTTIDFPLCTTLGSYVFSQCTKLISVNLPLCLSIPSGAFTSCYSLGTIVLPSCTLIGNHAFSGCTSLSSVNLPECQTINTNAFNYCRTLPEINLPLCTEIGTSAFYNCVMLSSVSLPLCTSLGMNAFERCSRLTSITLPSCTTIGNYAFSDCYGLTSITVPVCIAIGNYAFSGCYDLSSITLPVCATIGNYAFNNCSNLFSVYLLNSSIVTLSGYTAFLGTPISTSVNGVYGSIFVKASLYSSYLTATNWRYYSSRFVSLTDAEIEALGF